MKRFFSLAVLAVMVVALAVGCSKDDDNPVNGGNNNNNNNNNAAGSMTAKIDGSTWTANAGEAVLENGELDIMGIQGDSKASVTINMTLYDFQGTGTYELDGVNNSAYIIQMAEGGATVIYGVDDPESQTGGKLVVTEVTDKSVKGTFHFTAENMSGTATRSVTNGVFTFKLQ